MGQQQGISLFLYEEKYKESLMAFQLPAEQAEFTGLPSETLESAINDINKYAVVIVHEDMAVGFFILHTGEGIADFYGPYSHAMLLRAFLINCVSQGKGYAKAAILRLPEFMRSHFPSVHEVVLAVNEKNTAADRLYSHTGFCDNGLRRMGKKGVQKILQYDLLRSPTAIAPQEGELPLRLIHTLSQSPMLNSLFTSAQSLDPLPYYIGAGCLVQTVWNELTGRPLNYGISDIDIIYFDDNDLSYAAENDVVERAKNLFSHLPFPVDIKNQARVHLWYQDKFGIELEPYTSLEDAINSWPTTATCLGARLNSDNSWQIYAPYGLEDLFGLIVRPNKELIDEGIYYSKTQKWSGKWPELQTVSW
ncbi:nucleotidyltransferase family protein [Paenibacillus wynnii]|uniref:nucleotidyltransferase family protein n=1 Tax=Paenibacillus wynnii TaxID=268407 RepID=UPI00278DFC1E|nr:nucleotidyltransferase family protein [Paenibacillus wynnii]MDQ0195091.1 RimJ/RimL family protein N-acetyltransferase [Paenibacillus wynnii]